MTKINRSEKNDMYTAMRRQHNINIMIMYIFLMSFMPIKATELDNEPHSDEL